jgi:CubicO group peptidase (beta-lactamase class C family)
MNTGFGLQEAVRDARAATGVPGVAAGLLRDGETVFAADGVLELGREEPVRVETPFRIASITKPFTATLCAASVGIDERLEAFLSHTAGLRPESAEPLPLEAAGLWSYSNAGYWEAARLCGSPFDGAMTEHVLGPLGLDATGFAEPAQPARGHIQEGESGHHAVAVDAYPPARWPSGGLWSTVGDLLRFGAHHLDSGGAPATLHEPRAAALGGRYALGWWVREHADGRTTLDHEGSIAGYQSLLMLVPSESLALAVLTNSWRGSGLIRRVVESLRLLPRPPVAAPADDDGIEGTYELDGADASVERIDGGIAVTEAETDPVTGDRRSIRYPVRAIGAGVYGFAHGTLMGHRLDFPRPGIARIGWVALPRAELHRAER